MLCINGSSQDALHAVLCTIVAPRAPVVYRLGNEAIDVESGFFSVHATTVREQTVLEIANQSLASLEAGQVALSQVHHLNKDDDLFSVVLQSTETLGHP